MAYKKFKEWVVIKEDMTAGMQPTTSPNQPAPPKVQQNTQNALSKLQTTAAAGNPQARNTVASAKQFAPVAQDPKQAIQLAQSAQSLQQQQMKK